MDFGLKEGNGEEMMKIRKIVIVSVLVFVSCWMSMFVYAKGREDKINEKERTMFYNMQEKTLCTDVKKLLNEEGFTDSGVTVTRVVDVDSNREVTVTVHHIKFNRMEESEREEYVLGLLQNDIFDIGSPVKIAFLP